MRCVPPDTLLHRFGNDIAYSTIRPKGAASPSPGRRPGWGQPPIVVLKGQHLLDTLYDSAPAGRISLLCHTISKGIALGRVVVLSPLCYERLRVGAPAGMGERSSSKSEAAKPSAGMNVSFVVERALHATFVPAAKLFP